MTRIVGVGRRAGELPSPVTSLQPLLVHNLGWLLGQLLLAPLVEVLEVEVEVGVPQPLEVPEVVVPHQVEPTALGGGHLVVEAAVDHSGQLGQGGVATHRGFFSIGDGTCTSDVLPSRNSLDFAHISWLVGYLVILASKKVSIFSCIDMA